MKSSSFDAQITAIVFDNDGAIFALGDGSVRFEGGEFSAAHDGAILCAVAHPSGNGAITGGDDGRLVWHRRTDAGVLATSAKGQWIDAVDASAESGLIAFAAGKILTVLDAKDAGFRRDFQHERTVSGVGLGWDQLNGQNNNVGHPNYGLGDPIVGYTHHWVLRDMLGGHHGEPGTVATPAVPGDYFTHTFTTTLDPRWDDQDLDVQFGSVYFESKLAGRARYEVYAFGLDENSRTTRQRELLTFGGRVHQPRKAGDWN